MMENAPMLTSDARRAPAETIAVGWTLAIARARRLNLDVADSGHELRLRDQLVAHTCLGRELEDASHDVQLDGLEDELVAGEYRSLESRVVDAGEEQQRSLVMTLAARHVGKDRRDLPTRRAASVITR